MQTDELIDVVDDKDNVVDTVTREKLYRNKLNHRIVHILIFNKKGEVALQLRSSNVSYCPNHWSTTVGGHVDSGETYEEAALRESIEELGVELPIKFLRKDFYQDERGMSKFLTIFTSTFDGPFQVDPEEVEKVEFFSLAGIKKMIKKGEKFHPQLLFLLKEQFKIQ